MTRTALSVRAGELVRAAQALPTAKSADTLYEMIAAGAATLRPGVVTTLQLVDGDGVRLAAIAPIQASVSELDTDHARRVLNAAGPLLIRGKRAGERNHRTARIHSRVRREPIDNGTAGCRLRRLRRRR